MVRPAERLPDHTDLILARATVPEVGRAGWVRALVGAVGVVMLARSLPMLILGGGGDTTEHVGRHLGAFGAALAIGFLYAAWRPERAAGLLPLGTALAVAVVTTGVIDLLAGRSTALVEAGHLLELVGLAALWLLSGGRRKLSTKVGWLSPKTPLRAV